MEKGARRAGKGSLMKHAKITLQLILAVVLVVFGVVLIVVAFAFPPAGTIDPTVLTAYGETLTFSGALMGLDYRYRYRDIADNRSERM